MTINICRGCGYELDEANWSISARTKNDYICKGCAALKTRQWDYAHGAQPMSINRACPAYLGIHVAERVLSYVFKNVVRMPKNNHVYDYVCGRGHKVDVKSSCLRTYAGHSPHWMFSINKNVITKYFLCLAFDNREDLNPMHIWLLPGSAFNHLVCTTISTTKISKWDEYRLDISKVSACCNVMKAR